MPTKRKTRQRSMNPVAVRRALYADRWVPRYRLAIQKVLNRWTRTAAETASIGLRPEVDRNVPRWAEELAAEKRRWLYAVVLEGYTLAGHEVEAQEGKSSDDWRGKAEPGGAVLVGQKPEEFLVQGHFADIDKWVQTTALAEAETQAKDLTKIFTDAEKWRDPETGRGRTAREIAQEIERQGLSVYEVGKKKKKGLGKDRVRATMLARTGTIWAMNEGAQQRYRAAGVTAERWLTTPADAAVCPWCRAMDGKVVRIDRPFWPGGADFGVRTPEGKTRVLKIRGDVQHPPLHPNCLIGETPVLAPGKDAGLVATYSGPVVEIAFANSRRLTVTPNHMLLTPGGFARAASLREGDDVIDGTALEGIVAADPDYDGQPTPIRDVVESLAKSRGVVTTRVPAAPEHLHGDGAFLDGEIDVVAADGLVSGDGQSSTAKPRCEPLLRGSDIGLHPLDPERDPASVLLALGFAAHGGVCGRCECAAFAGRESCHSELVRLADGSYRDTSAHQASVNDGAADAIDAGDGVLRPPFGVPTTHVTGLRVRQHSGHVFDLQTLSGLYIANGVLSSNCRCTMVPVLPRMRIRRVG